MILLEQTHFWWGILLHGITKCGTVSSIPGGCFINNFRWMFCS